MANALRDKVASGELATLMAAHNPLSARLAEEAGFDGIWASGFELSAAYGVPDASLLSFTPHLDMTRAIIEQIADPARRRSRYRLRQRDQCLPCRRRLCARRVGGCRDRGQDLPEGHLSACRRPAGAGARGRIPGQDRGGARRRCGPRPARDRPHRGADRRSRASTRRCGAAPPMPRPAPTSC